MSYLNIVHWVGYSLLLIVMWRQDLSGRFHNVVQCSKSIMQLQYLLRSYNIKVKQVHVSTVRLSVRAHQLQDSFSYEIGVKERRYHNTKCNVHITSLRFKY